MKKLENKQQEKVNIIPLDVYWNMNMSKTRIDYLTVDLSRQRRLDAVPKAIKQIELLGQVKQLNNTNNNPESVYLTILEIIKETRLKLSQGSAAAL